MNNLLHQAAVRLAGVSFENLDDAVYDLLRSLYVQLVREHGSTVLENDRFHLCFVQALASSAVYIKICDPNRPDEFQLRSNEATMKLTRRVLEQIAGASPQDAQSKLLTAVSDLSTGRVKNPFELQSLHRSVIAGAAAYFSGNTKRGLRDLSQAASRGYVALGATPGPATLPTRFH